MAEALANGAPVLQARHRRGASLTLPGSDDAAFLGRPGSGLGLLPAHVVVRARDLERVLAALERTGRLALALDARGVRTFRPCLSPAPAAMQCERARANVATVAGWLRGFPTGREGTGVDLLARLGAELKGVVRSRGETPPPDGPLRRLIGRGAGSTPAGDDLVTGALAHAWATRGQEAPIVAAMRALAPELPALTTTLGATYLRAATRGEFGSHLVAWVRALPRASPDRALALARRVASHGATSGRDTLAGFVAAAEASDAATAPR